MSIYEWLIVSDSLTILLCSLILLASARYNEGFFGHVALAGLVLASLFVSAGELLGNVEYKPLPEFLLAYTAAAVFLGNTTCRLFTNERRSDRSVTCEEAPQKHGVPAR